MKLYVEYQGGTIRQEGELLRVLKLDGSWGWALQYRSWSKPHYGGVVTRQYKSEANAIKAFTRMFGKPA